MVLEAWIREINWASSVKSGVKSAFLAGERFLVFGNRRRRAFIMLFPATSFHFLTD